MSDLPNKRFSLLYLPRGEPVRDSSRMRKRIAVLASRRETDGLWSLLEQELGVDVPFGSRTISEDFFIEAELRDLLDSITIIHRYWQLQNYPTEAATFLAGVRRILMEENCGYRVDDQGVVHFAVDAVFEGVTASVLAGLGVPRYENVRDAFERALNALDETPPNGKAAIRGVFSATEGLFRLMYPNAPRLAASEAGKWLRPDVDRLGAGDPTARRAASKVFASFTEWVEAAHFYRHEPGTEEPALPPLDLAVLLVSQGAGFLRWLTQLDTQARASLENK